MEFNAGFGRYLVPLMILAGQFLESLLLSAIIRNGGGGMPYLMVVNMVLGVGAGMLVFSYFYHGGAKLLEWSRELRHIFENKGGPYRRRCVKSLRDIRIRVGAFYNVERGSFLNSAEWIVDQAITIIFAF